MSTLKCTKVTNWKPNNESLNLLRNFAILFFEKFFNSHRYKHNFETLFKENLL